MDMRREIEKLVIPLDKQIMELQAKIKVLQALLEKVVRERNQKVVELVNQQGI